MTKEQKEYLDKLRESGVTNMFGATPYIMDRFSVNKDDAKDILVEWMNTFYVDNYENDSSE